MTPFLPGDSLLFAAGALAPTRRAARRAADAGLLTVAAVLGDAVNYAVGTPIAPTVFAATTRRAFDARQAGARAAAHAFFVKYGGKAVVLGALRADRAHLRAVRRRRRATMPYRTFALYNVVGGGGCGWASALGAGYRVRQHPGR